MPRRILIADDEPLIRARLRRLLTEDASYEIVAEAVDGSEAVVAIAAHRPDVVFLDIRMPGLDGLAVAASLHHLADDAPAIVFVTAYDEYAAAAFDVGAIDYLLKPIDSAKVARALSRAEHWRAAHSARAHAAGVPPHRTRFAVRDANGTYFVPTTDVGWIDGAGGNYVRLHAGRRVHLVRGTITAIVATLDPSRFVRVHRSVIVRLDQILRVKSHAHGTYRITLRDGTRLWSSRTYTAQVRARLREPSQCRETLPRAGD